MTIEALDPIEQLRRRIASIENTLKIQWTRIEAGDDANRKLLERTRAELGLAPSGTPPLPPLEAEPTRPSVIPTSAELVAMGRDMRSKPNAGPGED